MKSRKQRSAEMQSLKHACGVPFMCEVHKARKQLHAIEGYLPAGPFKRARLAKEKAYRERQKGVA